ncbi:MAG: Calx-beta domain-containing protein [Gemmatimonadales bacterium]|nr:Calx-beta domain-containing protein [Gemmatimonadales bacterium]
MLDRAPLTRYRSLIVAIAWLGALASSSAAQAGTTGISVADVSIAESGTTGTDLMAFVVRVTRDTSVAAGQVSVQFQASSGTATVSTTQCAPGVDIVVQPSTLTIAATAREGVINAILCDDALDEADAETFTLTLLSPFGATIQDGQATGTVLDNDPPPGLRVADLTVAEGAPGEQRIMNVVLSLTNSSGRQVTVSYAVAAASGATAAQAGAACGGAVDFVARTGTETFPPGTTSRQVPVTLCGDSRYESDERIAVTLSAPTNATISDGAGVGTIGNDDPQPLVSVLTPNDGMVTEGSGTPQQVTIQVTLSNPNHDGASVTLTWGGTATRGTACTGTTDFTAGSNPVVLTWAAGNNTPQDVNFSVCGDAMDEENDTIELNVTATTILAAAPGETTNRMVIFDDDAAPTISVADVAVDEGQMATLVVTLSAVSGKDIDVLLATEPAKAAALRRPLAPATSGSSCAGDTDFIKTTHRVQVPAGQLSSPNPLRVTTCTNSAGLTAEPAIEVFLVTASDPNNATIAKGTAQVGIRDR